MTPNSDVGPDRSELGDVLELFLRTARSYLDEVDERPVLTGRVEEALDRLSGPLPQEGDGAVRALGTLVDEGLDA